MTERIYIITNDKVIDDLTSEYTDSPLSANQGRLLKESIDAGISPSPHATTHRTGGSDEITPALIGAQPTLTFDYTPTVNSENPVTSGGVYTSLGEKVDKVTGMGLSTNNFTTAFKNKLTAIPETAQENVIETVKVNGTAQTVTSKAVDISVPTTVSELSDSSSYALKSDVNSSISTHNSDSSAHTAIRQSVSSEVSRAEGRETELQNQIDALAAKTDVVDVVGTKAELLAYDTSILHNNDIVKVLVDESQDNAISYYRWVITEGVGAWDYVGSQGPFYTKTEADEYFVPQQRTVNGKSLANNITLTASDVSALPSSTPIGTAAAKDVPVSGNASSTQVVLGSDTRLSDARTPTSHAAAATTYGVASASNYGHPKASSSTPAKDGTGAVGTDNGLYARADHVHPTQILFGTTEPSSSDGEVGDIHIQFE